MRLINKYGDKDLPYEMTVLAIMELEHPQVTIAAEVVGDGDLFYMGNYSTKKEALEDLSRMRMAYADGKPTFQFGRG